MDESALVQLLNVKITAATGNQGTLVSGDREKALQRYKGEKYGNEVPGNSQVVSRDVMESIESLMPSLVEVFASGDEVVRYDPVGQEDEEVAAQQTAYANWVYQTKNDGFRVTYSAIKDGLMFRLGVAKIYWDKRKKVTTHHYSGLTDQELSILQSEKGVTVSEVKALPGYADELGQPVELYDVKIKRVLEYGCIKIDPMPPEEFLADVASSGLDDGTFWAHRMRTSVSDLIAMGFKEEDVINLPDAAEAQLEQERSERFEREQYDTDETTDPMMRKVEVFECYVKCDYDDDGIGEWRKVVLGGSNKNKVLLNEEIDDHPFAAWTPIPLTHSLLGFSVVDHVEDLQEVKTALWRQMLDNLYRSNNPEREINTALIEDIDDWLTSRVGGIKRVKQIGASREITVPFTASASFKVVEYVDAMAQRRVGAQMADQAMDADTLNKSATAASIADNRSFAKTKLYARLFAEQFMKRLFKRILKLSVMHQDKQETVRFRGKWVQVDPRVWDADKDVTVTVGLGTGNRDRMAQQIMNLLNLDEKIISLQGGAAGPLLKMDNVYAKLKKLLEALGLRGAEQYYSDPADAEAQPQGEPPPDPRMIEVQAKMQVEQQKLQASQQEAAAKMQVDMQRMQMEFDLKREQLAQELQLKREVAMAELELKRQGIAMGAMTGASGPSVNIGGEPG